MDESLRSSGDERVDCSSRTRAGEEPVIIEQHDPACEKPGVEEGHCVEGGLEKVDIDVNEGEPSLADALETLRDPASVVLDPRILREIALHDIERHGHVPSLPGTNIGT